MFDAKPCTIMIVIQIHLTMGSRIEMSKNFGDRLSVYENFGNLSKISPIFRYLSVFLPIFWDISSQSSPYTGYKICAIFLKKKHKMLFRNLIMICKQRLCFSALLKNRGFMVREI